MPSASIGYSQTPDNDSQLKVSVRFRVVLGFRVRDKGKYSVAAPGTFYLGGYSPEVWGTVSPHWSLRAKPQ